MLKIDSTGATVDNLFTEGSPSQGVPATVVSAKWLNVVQEEIVNVVTSTGQDLDQTGAEVDQLLESVKQIVAEGGDLQEFAIANDVQTPATLALSLDSAEVVSAKIGFDLQRRTDTQSVAEAGDLHCTFNNETSAWSLALESYGDDAGVTFSISNAGVISYVSTDLTGGTHLGELRVNNIKKLGQAA